MLPLVQQFHNSHNRLVDWMMEAESQLQVAEPREEDIARLELDIQGEFEFCLPFDSSVTMTLLTFWFL